MDSEGPNDNIKNMDKINDVSNQIISLEEKYENINKKIIKKQRLKDNFLLNIDDKFFVSFLDEMYKNKTLKSDINELFSKLYFYIYTDNYHISITNHEELIKLCEYCSNNLNTLNTNSVNDYNQVKSQYNLIYEKYIKGESFSISQFFEYCNNTFEEIDLLAEKSSILSQLEELTNKLNSLKLNNKKEKIGSNFNSITTDIIIKKLYSCPSGSSYNNEQTENQLKSNIYNISNQKSIDNINNTNIHTISNIEKRRVKWKNGKRNDELLLQKVDSDTKNFDRCCISCT